MSRRRDETACFLCDFWWLILLLLVIIALALTSGYWIPLIFPPPPPPPTSLSVEVIPDISETSIPEVPTPSAELSTPIIVAPTATLEPIDSLSIELQLRLETLGTGDIQVSLLWDSYNDIDLWVVDPSGTTILWSSPISLSGGVLDKDSNHGCVLNRTNQAVENIYWPLGEAPQGEYKVLVNYYQQCEDFLETPYQVILLIDGKRFRYSGILSSVGETQEIYRFTR